MAIKLEPTYTEFEVARILKKSEGEVFSDDDPGGHAEGKHELRPAGSGRKSTSFYDLEFRLADDPNIAAVSAFDGCQAKAIACALNTKGGQASLRWLCYDTALAVFAQIDISHGAFRMVTYSQDDTEAPPSGARFVVGPSGKTFLGMPARRVTTAKYIGIKLMKTTRLGARHLHIRTAYPIAGVLDRPTARIAYKGNLSLLQELPV
jgi:hypothetical protein